MRLILRLLISAAIIFGIAYLSDGALLSVDGFAAAVWAAIVLGLANAVIKPIVSVLSLPITLLTLGLFSLVINAFMLYIVAWIVPGFEVVGFFRTVLAALIIAVVSSVATKLVERDD